MGYCHENEENAGNCSKWLHYFLPCVLSSFLFNPSWSCPDPYARGIQVMQEYGSVLKNPDREVRRFLPFGKQNIVRRSLIRKSGTGLPLSHLGPANLGTPRETARTGEGVRKELAELTDGGASGKGTHHNRWGSSPPPENFRSLLTRDAHADPGRMQ